MKDLSTLDLMQMYASMEVRLKALKAELEQINALQTTVSDELAGRLDPNDLEAAFAHTFPNGVTVQVQRQAQERWVPVDGQSDEFWGWVFNNNLAQQFCTRALKQEGVDTWRAAHKTAMMPEGELPPFIKRMTIVKPKIGVKGLTNVLPPAKAIA